MQLFCKVYFLLFGSLSRTLCVCQFFLHFKHLEPPIALAFCWSQVYMVELENREVDENNMSKAATSTQRHRSRHDDRLNGECQSLSGLSWVGGDNQIHRFHAGAHLICGQKSGVQLWIAMFAGFFAGGGKGVLLAEEIPRGVDDYQEIPNAQVLPEIGLALWMRLDG